MRILIASRNALTRSALRMFLQEGCGWEVVGEAADSEEVLAELETKNPSVLLLEWELPGQPAADFLSRLRGLNHRLSVLVLSGRPELAEAAHVAGADGFFNLGEPPRRLWAALDAIGEQSAAV